jgi:hypothetical protein
MNKNQIMRMIIFNKLTKLIHFKLFEKLLFVFSYFKNLTN